jgi:hypothetical protein
MSGARLFSFNDFVESFKKGELENIYLIKTSSMAYTGLIRSVNSDSIIMDLPLKFYSGDNVIYTPVIIDKEEIFAITEVPTSGNIEVKTKNGIFAGEIESVHSNRMIINSGGIIETLYYQDFLEIS